MIVKFTAAMEAAVVELWTINCKQQRLQFVVDDVVLLSKTATSSKLVFLLNILFCHRSFVACCDATRCTECDVSL